MKRLITIKIDGKLHQCTMSTGRVPLPKPSKRILDKKIKSRSKRMSKSSFYKLIGEDNS